MFPIHLSDFKTNGIFCSTDNFFFVKSFLFSVICSLRLFFLSQIQTVTMDTQNTTNDNNDNRNIVMDCQLVKGQTIHLPIDMKHCYFHTISKYVDISSIPQFGDLTHERKERESKSRDMFGPLMDNFWNHLMQENLVSDNNIALYHTLKKYMCKEVLCKYISVENPMFQSFFEDLLNNIETRIRKCTISVGETVGMISAQNISEDATQKYLKVVHFTGSGTSKQFLKTSNKLNTILQNANNDYQMVFNLKRGHDPNNFAMQIVQTHVQDILSIKHTSYAVFSKERDLVTITLCIDTNKIAKRNKSLYQVKHILCNAIGIHVNAVTLEAIDASTHKCDITIHPKSNIWTKIYSLDAHLAFTTPLENKHNRQEQQEQQERERHGSSHHGYKQFLANNILQDICQNVLVSGYEGVMATSVTPQSTSNTGHEVVAACTATANCYKHILVNYFKQINPQLCYTNKLNKFNELYGIVATKHKLRNLLTQASASCVRHLETLSNLMTVSTEIKGLSRHQAIHQMQPMGRAAFSSAFKHLQKACQDAEFDSCSNLCSGLLVNNIQNVGKQSTQPRNEDYSTTRQSDFQSSIAQTVYTFNDYLCSPKADGVRRLVLIHRDCVIAIDRTWNMSILYKLHTTTEHNPFQISWTLLDAELIQSTTMETKILVFDALLVHGHSLARERYDIRYLCAKKIVEKLSSVEMSNIRMSMKPIFTFRNIHKLKHLTLDFPTDGLVFTKASNKLTPQTRGTNNDYSTATPECFKWKPTNEVFSENTIDVFIRHKRKQHTETKHIQQNTRKTPLEWGDFVRPKHQPTTIHSNNTQEEEKIQENLDQNETLELFITQKGSQQFIVVGHIQWDNIKPEHQQIIQEHKSFNKSRSNHPVFEVQWNYIHQAWFTTKHRTKNPNSHKTIIDTLECIKYPVKFQEIIQCMHTASNL